MVDRFEPPPKGFYDNHTREQLIALCEMNDLAIYSLLSKVKKVQRVSRSRLRRMNQRGKLLINARAELFRLSREAHGG